MAKYTISSNSSTTSYVARTEHVNFVVSGTWGSGTLAVEVKDQPSGDWVSVYSDTANFKYTIKVGIGNEYRLTLSGATSPSLTAYDLPVRALSNALFL